MFLTILKSFSILAPDSGFSLSCSIPPNSLATNSTCSPIPVPPSHQILSDRVFFPYSNAKFVFCSALPSPASLAPSPFFCIPHFHRSSHWVTVLRCTSDGKNLRKKAAEVGECSFFCCMERFERLWVLSEFVKLTNKHYVLEILITLALPTGLQNQRS